MRVLLIIALLFNTLFTVLFAQEKIALLVGVGNYGVQTGWAKLNSTNDLVLVKDALLRRGFKEDNIFLLEDEAATKAGLLDAIEKKLIAKAKLGSVAVFHYSGHGQQMQDDNGDELDGLDEALVPHDSNKYFVKGVYEGEKLVRDDELEILFNQLRTKLGKEGQLLVLMDACHSGTATRAMATARGTDVVMASKAYISELDRREESREESRKTIDKKSLAPMISFFSSRAGQLSYERRGEDGKGYGLLSYAFSKAFSQADKNVSYRALFEEIRSDIQSITSIQSPQAEGVLDLPLFRNQILGETSYLTVKEAVDYQILILNAGTLHGVHEGAKIGFYPPDTRNTKITEPLAVGTIIYADIINADVEFDTIQDMTQLQNSWAYITEKNYGALQVKVKSVIDNEAISQYFNTAFAGTAIIELVDEYPDVLIQMGSEKQLELLTKEGNVFAEFTDLNQETAQEVKAKLLGYAQADYLRQLKINNPLLKAKLEIVNNGKTMDNVETAKFKVNDELQIRITNVGKEPFYFSLLDIMPDNAIAAVDLSNGKHSAEELYLEEGKSFESVLMKIQAPFGFEVFKLVTSTELIDLSVIKGTATRSNTNPFEQMLQASNPSTNTRGTTPNVPTSFEINVETAIFEIKE